MLNKQNININFSQGLDTKTDPWQVALGKFLSLENSVFDKGGRLTKRNGYSQLEAAPNIAPYLTTLNDNLTTISSSLSAYNSDTQQWVSKGSYTPLELSTLPLIRNSIDQIQCDAGIAPNGLVCTVYSEEQNGTTDYKYVIANSVTGQNIIEPTLIPAAGGGTITGSPRVFILTTYFVIIFTNVISATPHLQYICIPSITPSFVTAPQDIASSYFAYTTVAWDGIVINNTLFITWNTTTGGQAIDITTLSPQRAIAGQAPPTPTSFVGPNYHGSIFTICADTSNPNFTQIYITYLNPAQNLLYTFSVDVSLRIVFPPTSTASITNLINLVSTATDNVCTVYLEEVSTYQYGSFSVPNNFLGKQTISNNGTGISFVASYLLGMGLASKAFMLNGSAYFLASFESEFQSTYFLINSTLTTINKPYVVAKLAYENGGGYLTTGLPGVSISGTSVSIPYLFKDFISALAVQNNSQQTTQPGTGVYSQTGINLATFDFTESGIDAVETAASLQIGGGFLWQYDGYLPVEHNFFLWPDNVDVTLTGGSGNMTSQQYFYQAIYSWSDNQGNIHRSAPSIPATITLTGQTITAVYVPTLRLTYKFANPVKIQIYRWSAGQQIYYEVTSIANPLLNDPTVDFLVFTDTQSDSQIEGNAIIYTEGGVLEDINAPASNILTLYDSRLWLVDAEDPNLLWFSKQVIEATPVEMSDLLTFYVAPTIGAQGSTGDITALAPMDDKLIIFKENAIYYINGAGQGPDNTGANNGYSQPVFITSTVGCANQQSIVFMPQGLLFQSNKGIWLLNRFSLQAEYKGAPVEQFTQPGDVVQSAVNVPFTNQVRFTLNTGVTLMYDYYYEQWGAFVGVPAVSSCIYQNLHTFLNSSGTTYQESPGSYTDGTEPVLMQFQTSWVNIANLQGFERAYYFYLLAEYLSPHFLQVQLAYNYNPSAVQSSLIYPRNFSASTPSPFGDQSAPFGSPSNIEQWRVFFKQQKCQSFQITVQEFFDPSYGTQPGAGLNISGLSMLAAVKRGVRPLPARQSVG